MCNSVVTYDDILPATISTQNNAILHFCWDNFDLNEETPTGAGTTHSTHGIVIQEIQEGTVAPTGGLPEMEKSHLRTIQNPVKIDLDPCYAKRNAEPNFKVVSHIKPKIYNFSSINLSNFSWVLCRKYN